MVFERLSAELDLDSSGFTRGVENAKSSIQGLGDRTRRVGKGMQSAGKTMSLGVSAPLGAMAAGSAKAAADFESNMQESLAIMSDVGDGMRNEMAAEARNMAKETTFSADQAAKSYFYLASAGLDAQQSMEQMGNVARFAQAGMFDMATATDLLTDANSALGRETKEMVGLSDMLVQANQQANATVEQFSKSLTKKGAAAMKRLGVEAEEGIAVLSAFADQGLKGERAGTILARALGGLERTARKNGEALEKMGVQVMNANGELRPMYKIIGDLEKATEGMSTAQRNAALSQLGLNARAQRGIDMMMGNSEAIKKYKSNLENAQGSTEEVANKQLKSLNSQLKLLKSQVMDVAITIGNDFAPHLKKVVQHAQEATERFSELSERQRKLGIAAAAVAAAIGPLLFAIGTLITVGGSAVAGLGTLVGTLTGVASAFSLTSSAVLLLLGPLGLVAGAAAAVAYGIKTDFAGMGEAANFVAREFRASFIPVWYQLQDTVTAVMNAIRPHVEGTMGSISDAFDKAMGRFETALEPVVLQLRGGLIVAIDATENALMGFLVTVERIANNGFNWGGPINFALGKLADLRASIESFVGSALSRLPSVSVPFGAFTDAVNSAKSTVVTAFGVVKGTLNGVRTSVAKFAAKARGALPTVTVPVNKIAGAFQMLQTTVASVIAVVRSTIGTFVSTVRSKFSTAVGLITSKFNSADKSAGKLSDKLSALKSAVLTTANAGASVLSSKLGTLKSKILGIPNPMDKASTASLLLGKRLIGLTGPIGFVISILLQLQNHFNVSFTQIQNIVGQTLGSIITATEAWGSKMATTLQTTLKILVKNGRVMLSLLWDIFRTKLLPIVVLVAKIYNKITSIIAETLAFVVKTVVPTLLGDLASLWQRHMGELAQEAVMTFNSILQTVMKVMNFVLRIINRVLGVVKQVVGAALVAINEIWRRWGSEIKMFVAGVFDFIRVVVVTVLDGILVLIRTVLALIRGDWEMAWGLIRDYLFRTLGRVLTYAQEWGPRFVGWLKVFLNKAWDKFVKFGTWLLTTFIPNLFGTIISTAKTEGPKFITWLKNWLDNAVSKFVTFSTWLITTFLPNLFGKIVSTAEEHGPKVVSWYTDFVNRIGNTLYELVTWVADTFVPELFDTFKSAIDSNSSKAESAVGDVKQALVDKISGLTDPFRTAGEDAMTALKDGIENKIGEVKGAAGDAASGIRDKLPGSDAKEGPLSDLTDAADAVPETFEKRIADGTRGVTDAAETLASAAEPHPDVSATTTGTNTGKRGKVTRELRLMRRALEDMDADIADAEVEVTDDGLLRFVDGRIEFKKERESIDAFSRNIRTN